MWPRIFYHGMLFFHERKTERKIKDAQTTYTNTESNVNNYKHKEERQLEFTFDV